MKNPNLIYLSATWGSSVKTMMEQFEGTGLLLIGFLVSCLILLIFIPFFSFHFWTVLFSISSSSIPEICVVGTPWTTMSGFDLCTVSSSNAVFQLTSCRRSLASSGELHCSRIPFVILFILFIFSGLSVVFNLSTIF